ncbi:vomeronasal type-2 receptor 26-like [Rana temporaria]|uniref:vomeronasal type-2 receptor 26-like n=1 Tax=Rana temporaria TaxID=8407 RepID=UPI001AAD911C|nr:vomeronasal type-2 receptor 26-like [Rana temporaria]
MASMQSGKTPGPDGIPVEFYSIYQEHLVPRFASMLQLFYNLDSLPESMSEAIVVLVPKPGKDPEECASYMPFSLINADARVLAKNLAIRLGTVIEDLVQVDQTGFMPGKGTDINIRRLFLNLATSHDKEGTRVIASLHAEKAFDSVEWEYLWEVLRRFSKLHRYIEASYYFSENTSHKYFNEDGEFVTQYVIQNHLLVNKTILTNDVGLFEQSNSSDQNIFINASLIKWKNDQKEIPRSQCSEDCLPGNREVPSSNVHECCHGCVPCSEGEISNETGSENCMTCLDQEWPNENKTECNPKQIEFLSYTESLSLFFMVISLFLCIITFLIMTVFISYGDTPIVRANNKSLSFVLLVSIMLGFLCVFLFLGRPLDTTCRLRQTSFGFLFTIAVSSVLGKTVMVWLAFKATKPGSVWKKWVGVKLPNFVVFICSSIQVLICIAWLSVSPPFQELDKRSYQTKIIVQCNEGSVVGFYSVLGYMGILAAVSFVTAFLARTLPDSYNEAKYITFSMLVFCSVWIAMIPAYLSTKGKYMVAVEIFAILTSNAGLLGCIFFPKFYIILCHPDLNSKKHLLDNRCKSFLQ